MALSFIKSSGNIITEDFCISLAGETKADYVKDKSFGQGMKRVDETTAVSFELLRGRWEELRTQIISDQLDTTTLRRRWIIPFLEYLDFKPVYLASNIISKSGIEYHIPYKGWDSDNAPYIHMVHSSQDFDLKDKSSRTHINKSPHDALQQYLNTSNHQWAILTNGKKIRILRDFYHSITKGFLEFDLEAIFENASTEHFRVLYRILHRTRFENQYKGAGVVQYDDEGNPVETEETCLLEKFHKKSRETGVKIGTHLRDQVVDAIEKLGNGFAGNLDPDEFQNGKIKGFYNEILNIIYRLLFLMFAEQKGWLPVRNLIYSQTYSIGTIRETAERGGYDFDEETDLWDGLKITFRLASDGYTFPNGDTINAFGGQLFSEKKIKTLIGLSLENRHLLDAVYRLSYFKVDNVINRINYANLAIDELGSVYESLLDFEPMIALSDIKIGSREIKRGEFYLDSRGTERKTTGSYYTDSRLVAQLIDSALVPVIDNALTDKLGRESKEKALLDLKVADIACGSGAFLCAAMERLGERLALIRKGEEERPTDEQLREAKRDVLLNCIYGVDLNPMAVELAKFSLWITASLPDMPLSFLDHKIKCGNSLIGATPDLVKKGIPEGAYNAVTLDNPDICSELRKKVKKELQQIAKAEEPSPQYGLKFLKSEKDELLHLRESLIRKHQEDIEEVDQVEEEYRKLEKMERKFKDWIIADVWTSAFFIQKTNHDLTKYPINSTLETIRENQVVDQDIIEEAIRLSHQFRFFHFHLEYPEVFEKGGFDCVLGNPPWDKVRIQEKEFFIGKNDKISKLSKANRTTEIENLRESNPQLYYEFLNAKDRSEKEINFFSKSGNFPLMGNGDLDLANLFSEIVSTKVNNQGYIGIIVPTGIVTGESAKEYFDFIRLNKLLVSIIDFNNSRKIFKDVDSNKKFCLITLSGASSKSHLSFLMFNLIEPEQINDASRKFSLEDEDFVLLNPNTKNCPVFGTQEDARLNLKIYRSMPILFDENKSNGWLIEFERILDSSLDSSLFSKTTGKDYLPVYEGKMIDQYNHRFASASNPQGGQMLRGSSELTSLNNLVDINYEVTGRDFVKKVELEKVIRKGRDYLFCFRRTGGNVANIRTAVFAIIPKVPASDSIFVIDITSGPYILGALLISNGNTFIFDYLVRCKISGINLSYYIIKQIPTIPLSWYGELTKTEILKKVCQLSYTSHSLDRFGEDINNLLGSEGGPFKWNENDRFRMRCELDAIYAHLYGLMKSEMEYILDTFPIVKRKDIDRYGSYRTKEIILKMYDEFAWVREEMKKGTKA